MGVTASTPANLVVGAGDVYVDNSILGASIDNNVFRIERDYFTPDLNGTKGALVGTTYISRSEGVMECSIPEVDDTVTGLLWPGSQATGTDPVILDEDDTRRIPTADYHDWTLRVDGLNAKLFLFEIDNGLNRGNLEFTGGDDSVMAPRAEVHSYWNAGDLASAPHRISISAGTGS